MSGRLAVDFGTSNTVLALWDPQLNDGVPIYIPEFGRIYSQGAESISVIPSLIHYTEDNRRWTGEQVIERGLYHSRRTFRWMKRYISQRSPIKIKLEGREITPFTAGKDFLTTLLLFAFQEYRLKGEEIALSVPVESFEHYEEWLSSVADSAGMPHFRLIDEPSAAALGYGSHIQPGHVYLIFDFGGGTMHAAVVLMEAEEGSSSGRRCRVLGKAGKYIGGTSIDQWIFAEVLKQNGHTDYEESIRTISTELLVECERAKETLSGSDATEINVKDPTSGLELKSSLTRASFEALLDQHDLFAEINRILRSALNAARERGYDEDCIQSALMVGGSSAIPSVQRALRQLFGNERVLFHRPLDAVARGAAAFVAGVDFYDHIQHDYAIRFVNPKTSAYDYRVVVKRGTPYPTEKPTTRLTVKASFDGQKQLGIAIFELSEKRAGATPGTELVFDPSGAARMIQVTPQEIEERQLFWMNEDHPTFLAADPPGKQGEPRFAVEFGVDSNKRLILTARDLNNNRLVYSNIPVVKLI
ncbi:MAG TPA: Hsp70 family protein [Anaerolineaceae bacterium]|nr:Hsp70 family protein [Anaerolineaceae bacterium]